MRRRGEPCRVDGITVAWRPSDAGLRTVPDFDLTVREAIKLIEDDGWFLARQRGSHRQFIHPVKPGVVTVSGHPPKDLAPKTLKSILRQAGLVS